MGLIGNFLGQRGERLAEKFLRRKGYRTVARNFRTREGELDLVCRDGDCLVFVEVKTRAPGGLGFPEDAVTADKQRKMLAAVNAYLARLLHAPASFRIDVVSITTATQGPPQIIHLENITG